MYHPYGSAEFIVEGVIMLVVACMGVLLNIIREDNDKCLKVFFKIMISMFSLQMNSAF
jgi:hypothetical protein